MRNELLKQLNSKKVDLAIERNEVEELMEAATLRELQENKFAVKHKQSVLDISSNMLNMSIMTKKRNSKNEHMIKKQLTKEELIQMANTVGMLQMFQNYCKSVELFTLKSYFEINEHPDFYHLKKMLAESLKRKEKITEQELNK